MLSQTSTYLVDEEGSSDRRAGAYVLGALLLLAVIGGIAYLLANNPFGGEEAQPPWSRMVEVPRLGRGDRG